MKDNENDKFCPICYGLQTIDGFVCPVCEGDVYVDRGKMDEWKKKKRREEKWKENLQNKS